MLRPVYVTEIPDLFPIRIKLALAPNNVGQIRDFFSTFYDFGTASPSPNGRTGQLCCIIFVSILFKSSTCALGLLV